MGYMPSAQLQITNAFRHQLRDAPYERANAVNGILNHRGGMAAADLMDHVGIGNSSPEDDGGNLAVGRQGPQKRLGGVSLPIDDSQNDLGRFQIFQCYPRVGGLRNYNHLSSQSINSLGTPQSIPLANQNHRHHERIAAITHRILHQNFCMFFAELPLMAGTLHRPVNAHITSQMPCVARKTDAT